MSGPVMDFPAAWEYVRTTDPTDHHDQCSWRSTGGALLCDCTVLNDEYKRREARNEQGRRTRMNRQQELDIIAGVLRRQGRGWRRWVPASSGSRCRMHRSCPRRIRRYRNEFVTR